MIKRSAAILLTFLYISTAMGFAFNLHYCCSRLVSVKIDAPAKSCSMGAMPENKCCKNTHVEIKVKDAHQGAALSIVSKVVGFKLPALAFAALSPFANQVLLKNGFDAKPPGLPLSCRVTFLKNRVFRI
ncbi:MAG TPA: hypothetical protein VNW95_11190 [Mucilaginibacter sp.]|jgi:hypothetical protein|nr:hypothetical protein [Mucilaginibacter sp.]